MDWGSGVEDVPLISSEAHQLFCGTESTPLGVFKPLWPLLREEHPSPGDNFNLCYSEYHLDD